VINPAVLSCCLAVNNRPRFAAAPGGFLGFLFDLVKPPKKTAKQPFYRALRSQNIISAYISIISHHINLPNGFDWFAVWWRFVLPNGTILFGLFF
jgi:hypothetical protein